MTGVLHDTAICLCVLFDEHESLFVSDMVRYVVLLCRQSGCLLHSEVYSLSHTVAFLLHVCAQHVSFFRLLTQLDHSRSSKQMNTVIMGTMCVFYIYSVDEHLKWTSQQMKLLPSASCMHNRSRNSSPNLKLLNARGGRGPLPSAGTTSAATVWRRLSKTLQPQQPEHTHTHLLSRSIPRTTQVATDHPSSS